MDNHKSAAAAAAAAAAVFTDLSNAFDCLPFGLLIENMSAYGLAPDTMDMLISHLSDRVQQVSQHIRKGLKGFNRGSNCWKT